MRLIKKFMWYIFVLLIGLAVVPVVIFLTLSPFSMSNQFHSLVYTVLYLPLIALTMMVLDEIH